MTTSGNFTTWPGVSANPKNLALENPKKLKELKAQFLIEAVKHNVLPVDSSFADRANPALRPSFNVGRTEFTYYPGMIRNPKANAPDIKNKSFRISADLDAPQGGANGIIVTQGGRFGGCTHPYRDPGPICDIGRPTPITRSEPPARPIRGWRPQRFRHIDRSGLRAKKLLWFL